MTMRFLCCTYMAVLLLANAVRAQTTILISLASNNAQGDNASLSPSLSGDGRYVAFFSYATTFFPGTWSGADVFVRDVQSNLTTLASLNSGGVVGDGQSDDPAISSDGRFVAFRTNATNLFPSDTNGTFDVVLRHLNGNTTVLISRASGLSGVQGNAKSEFPAISADGQVVAFQSAASNLAPEDMTGTTDVFVRNVQTHETTLVSIALSGTAANGTSEEPSISADGRFVAFASVADNLVIGDTNLTYDVFVRDLQTNVTTRVSKNSNGVQGNGGSYYESISADGNYVAFYSDSTNLDVDIPDTNALRDVFLHNIQTGMTTRVNLGPLNAQSNGPVIQYPSVSSGGYFVVFTSSATNLLASGPTNGLRQVFVYNRLNDSIELASVNYAGTTQGNGNSNRNGRLCSISADGRYVAFDSDATNLVSPPDTNGFTDVFRRDRCSIPSSYCTAKVNSLGCLPAVGFTGFPSLTGPDNFHVTATNVLNNKLGQMLWSLSPANMPFGGGTLCLASTIHRTAPQDSAGSPTGNDCSGTYSYHFSQGYMIQELLGSGTTVHAQYWSRDPGFAPPNNIGLTNALRFTICP